MSSKPCLALWILWFSCSGSAAWPQEAPRETFTDVVEVEVVNLEVFVTDQDGRPVTDLTRDDFVVLEDGKPVELTHFAVYAAPAPASTGVSGPAAPPPPAPPQPTVGETPAGPLFLVVFVDNQNLRGHTRKALLDDLRVFLDRSLRPEDQVMIVSTEPRLRLRQGFTRDRAALAATLQQIEGDRPSGIDEDAEISRWLNEATHAYTDSMAAAGSQSRLAGDLRNIEERNLARARISLGVLEQFIGALAELPGRKVVLHLSDGISASTELAALRQVVALANTNRVTFFALNGGGGRQFSAQSAAQASVVQDFGWTAERATERESVRWESVAALAAETGGQVFQRGEHLEQNLVTLRDALDTYYSLGFKPRNSKSGQRALKVKVSRPGLAVRHPQSYRLKTADDQLREQVLAALVVKVTDNPLGIAIQLGEKKALPNDLFELKMLVRIPLDNVVLVPGKGVHQGKVRLMYAVADALGQISPVQAGELPLRIPNEQMSAAKGQLVGFGASLLMGARATRVAVAAYDQVAQTMTSAVAEFSLQD